jgi:hypothetical protein
MKRTLIIAAALLALSAPVHAGDLNPALGAAVQKANEGLYACMLNKTKEYAPQNEPAVIVARAARLACWHEESDYRRAFLRAIPEYSWKLDRNISSEEEENVRYVMDLRAPPVSCMADAPNGRAPAWAVLDERARGNNLRENDPIWQHATCQQGRREVKWSFPGGE